MPGDQGQERGEIGEDIKDFHKRNVANLSKPTLTSSALLVLHRMAQDAAVGSNRVAKYFAPTLARSCAVTLATALSRLLQ